MRRLTVMSLLAAVVVATLVAVPVLSAATGGNTYFRLYALPSGSCTPGMPVTASFVYSVGAGDISTHYWYLINERTGAATSSSVGPLLGPEGPFDLPFGYDLPIPAGTQAGDLLTMKVNASSELEVGTTTSITVNCNDGSVVRQTYGNWVYEAPPVPSGFVQKLITCDVAVYDSPAGTPVGDNMIKAGQEWHVNPVPVAGTDGQDWTEIFVGGVHTGFIPTHCVAPAITGYGQ